MSADSVVVGGIGIEDLTQVGFAPNHDVIQAFSADRADEPLRMTILPGRPLCYRVIPNTHRRETPPDGMAVGGVAVAYKMGRRTIPRKGLGDLARDPFCRRMIGDAQRDQASPFMPQDDQRTAAES